MCFSIIQSFARIREDKKYLDNFRIITLLAINYLRSFRRVTCLKLVGAGMLAMDMSGGILIYRCFGFHASCFGFPASALAGAMPQFQRVSLLDSLIMPAIGADTG